MYFVIQNRWGDTTVQPFTKAMLLKALLDEDFGDVKAMDQKVFDDEEDTNYWGDNILIIKGELVQPRPVEVVKEFEID